MLPRYVNFSTDSTVCSVAKVVARGEPVSIFCILVLCQDVCRPILKTHIEEWTATGQEFPLAEPRR